MQTTDPEGPDGIRLTWNAWPRTKVEASKCVIPFAASISPIKSNPTIQTNPYAPLRCKTCSSILNPFARVDYTSKLWICPFCFQRNHFPQHYSGISESNIPAELYPQCTTIEYTFPNLSNAAIKPECVYLFVIDMCVIEEELGFMKSAVQQAVEFLPENALVGVVTFGTQVQVHELGFGEMSKAYVFRGSKEISKDHVLEQLGLGSGKRGVASGNPSLGFQKGGLMDSGVSRFLLPASEGAYIVHSVSFLFYQLYFAVH